MTSKSLEELRRLLDLPEVADMIGKAIVNGMSHYADSKDDNLFTDLPYMGELLLLIGRISGENAVFASKSGEVW